MGENQYSHIRGIPDIYSREIPNGDENYLIIYFCELFPPVETKGNCMAIDECFFSPHGIVPYTAHQQIVKIFPFLGLWPERDLLITVH
jgi:hypothetical protein